MHPHPVAAALAAATALLLLSACGTPPPNLDLTLQHASAAGKFMVRMEPPATGPAIQQLHAWQLRLSTPDGTPVSQARIAIDGGMPQHGHGLPTRPRITHELAPGVYALEGMKFSMTGWWDLRLSIQAGPVADNVVFNLIVGEDGLRRGVPQ